MAGPPSLTAKELEALVDGHVTVDLTVAYEAFRKATGGGSADLFLAYLHDQKHLSDAWYVELQSRSAIEISVFDETMLADSERTPITIHEAIGPAASRSDRPPNSTVTRSRYNLLSVVGEGGMGLVYVARDLDLRRRVAFKQLRPEVASSRAIAERFLTEVQITAQLDHPNIVPVYGLEMQAGGSIGYAMKLVHGKTLRELLEETEAKSLRGEALGAELSLPTLLEHFLRICDAMAFAHSKGVLHRDLKPPNIMVGQYNEVYVMDWGIARLMGPSGGAGASAQGAAIDVRSVEGTEAGQLMGTPRYMSPEQLEEPSEDLDARSDQYSLGLILFEVATLKRAIPGDTLGEICSHVRNGTKVALSHLVPGVEVAPELSAIIEKATAKSRDDRYPSVRVMADDVRRYLAGKDVLARPDTPLQKWMRTLARNQRRTFAFVLFMLLFSAGSALSWSFYKGRVAAEEAGAHQEKRSAFFLAAARQSQEVNARLLQFEVMVESMASASEQALSRGLPGPDKFYTSEDFSLPDRSPPDLAISVGYPKPVSLTSAAWVLPSDAGRQAAIAQIEELLSIRNDCARIFLRGAAESGETISDDEARRRILADEAPLLRCYVGLASGVASLYPGTAGIPKTYDPRQRPWYRLAEGESSVRWGNPYVDQIRGEAVLPCSKAMLDESGGLLGVTGVGVRFDYLVRSLMTMPGQQAVRETFLLDGQGRVMVRSAGAKVDLLEGALLSAPERPLFTFEDVVAEVVAKRSGHLDLTTEEGDILIVYNRISVLGWYYAVVADAAILLGE